MHALFKSPCWNIYKQHPKEYEFQVTSFKINLLTKKHLKHTVYMNFPPLYFSKEELMAAEKGKSFKTMSLSQLHSPRVPICPSPLS